MFRRAGCFNVARACANFEATRREPERDDVAVWFRTETNREINLVGDEVYVVVY